MRQDEDGMEGLDDRQRAAHVKARAAGQVRTLLGEVEQQGEQPAKGCVLLLNC